MPPATLDEGVRAVVAPASVALIGASERSHWCRLVIDNVDRLGYEGELHLVHPRGGTAFGRVVNPSIHDIDSHIDLAVLMTSAETTLELIPDLARAGVGGFTVLASGYAELGDQGTQRQAAMTKVAREHRVAVLGPNSLGVLNIADRSPIWIAPMPDPVLRGSIALVTQSGNVGQVVADTAALFGIGLSHIVSTGNEAVLDASDIAKFLIEDSRVSVLTLFVESIRDPRKFLAVAERAGELSKPIVMMKVGVSPVGARVAQSHTGALAGDDTIIDAALRSRGVVRVDSLEQLVATAGLLATTGRLRPGGLGVMSISGGSNDIIADRAAALKVDLPALAPETAERMASSRVEVATLQNPFDMTGAAGRVGDAWVTAARVLAEDPAYALIVSPFARLSHPLAASDEALDIERFGWILEGGRSATNGCPVLLMLNTMRPVTRQQSQTLSELGSAYVLPGIEHGMVAIRDAMSWSDWHRGRSSLKTENRPPESVENLREDLSEREALDFLERHGFPTVPRRFAANRIEALEAAQDFGFPVVIKVSSRHIRHKTDVGGVALDLKDGDQLSIAFDRVMENALVRSGVQADGVIVAPMRPDGHELIVGIRDSDDWGKLLVVGLGGVYTEVMRDTAVALLPVDERQVEGLLRSLKASPILEGVRGEDGVDFAAVSRAIVQFGQIAEQFEGSLDAIEINPLRVRGDSVEALDALVVTRAQ